VTIITGKASKESDHENLHKIGGFNCHCTWAGSQSKWPQKWLE